MPKTTDDIVVGANGSVFVAPVGTEPPADISAEWGGGWVDLGFTDENGVKFTDSKTLVSIPVWQLFYAARRIISERDFSVDFALRQFDGPTVSLAFGGGDITEDSAGKYRYTPPGPETIDERAMGLEWLDGTKTFRLILPKGLVTSNVTTELTRTKSSDLPISFGIVGESGVAPWEMLTDDPAWADFVGS